MAIHGGFQGLDLGYNAQMISLPSFIQNSKRKSNDFSRQEMGQTINIYYTCSIVSTISQTLNFSSIPKESFWKTLGVCFLTPKIAALCSSDQKNCSSVHIPFNFLHHHISDLCYVAVCVSFCTLIYFGHYVAGSIALGWTAFQALKQRYHWNSWALNKAELSLLISLDTYKFIHGKPAERLMILCRNLVFFYLYYIKQKADNQASIDGSKTSPITVTSAQYLNITKIEFNPLVAPILRFMGLNTPYDAILLIINMDTILHSRTEKRPIAEYIENWLIAEHMEEHESDEKTAKAWVENRIWVNEGLMNEGYLIYFLMKMGVFQIARRNA